MFTHALSASLWLCVFAPAAEIESIPDKVVVLTFDDSVKSHFTVARPLLKKYGFNATFFITEGFDFKTNKQAYMTWQEIKQLHEDGFEIGNHTRDHLLITDENAGKLSEQLTTINDQCQSHGIPAPVSFAWPGNSTSLKALKVLSNNGINWARRGGAPEFPYEEGRGVAYEPGLDHPLLIPSAGDARPHWTLRDFKRAVALARSRRIAVLQFHGVPDLDHPWVNTPTSQFEKFLKYLHDERFTVLAMRDLKRFVDPSRHPDDPWAVVRQRTARKP